VAGDATKTIKGTHTYLSPAKMSALGGSAGQVKEDTEKGDVWSLGVTFLYTVMLEKPKNICNKYSCSRNVQRYLINNTKNYSDLVRYIIHWMLRFNESERWTFQ
jgi:serine/threonine protein kinase